MGTLTQPGEPESRLCLALVLELVRCARIGARENVIALGNSGTA